MKLLISVLLASLLILSSCDKVEDQMIGPNELQKGGIDTIGIIKAEQEFSLIPLPERSPIYLDSVFTITKLINGLLGGVISLDRTYISKEGKPVSILVLMVVPPNSFFGNRNITITIDDSLAIMHCEPGMNFQRSLSLVQTFSGLDLSTYKREDIDFAYITNDGKYSVIPKDQIIVVKSLGMISVINAKLNHFSRYGWVRTHEDDD